MSKTMKLGDTVRGDYRGTTVEGVLESFDGSGYLYVRLSPPVVLFGEARDLVCFDRWQRAGLEVVAEGPALTEDDVVQYEAAAMGGASLRRVS